MTEPVSRVATPLGIRPDEVGIGLSRSAFVAALAALTVVATIVRVVYVLSLPGIHADEAANGFDVLSVLAGSRPIFFPANTGREPLFIYFQAILAAAFGLSPLVLRSAGTIFAAATVPAVAFAGIEVARLAFDQRRSRVQALVASAAFAASAWHVYFGGFGLRAITLPFFTALTVGLIARSGRTNRLPTYVLAGLVGGATMYTYLASRVFPVVAVVAMAAFLVARPGWKRVFGSAVTSLVWFGTFVPLGKYLLDHAAEASLRTGSISIFAPEHGGGAPIVDISRSLVRHLNLVLPLEQFSPTIGGRTYGPMFDPLTLALGALGCAAHAWASLRRDTGVGVAPENRYSARIPALICLVWFAVMCSPSLGSINTPNYMRMLGAFVPAALVVGRGGEWLLSTLRPRFGRNATMAIVGVLAIGAVALNWSAFYSGWLGTERPWRELGLKYEAGRRLAELTADHRVYLAPLYFQDDAIRFGAGDSFDKIQIFDPRTPPLPSGGPSAFAFPYFDDEQPPILASRIESVRFTELTTPEGRPLLLVGFADPPARQSEPEPIVSFADTIDALSFRLEPPTVRPGDQLKVLVTWRARQVVIDDYTVFVHLRLGDSETVAQADVRPGSGKSVTYKWQPGDLLLDEIPLTVPSTAKPGQYRVVIGLYRLANLQRLETNSAGKSIPGNEYEIGKVTVSP